MTSSLTFTSQKKILRRKITTKKSKIHGGLLCNKQLLKNIAPRISCLTSAITSLNSSHRKFFSSTRLLFSTMSTSISSTMFSAKVFYKRLLWSSIFTSSFFAIPSSIPSAIFPTKRPLFSSFCMLLFFGFLQQRLFFFFADFCFCTGRLAAIFYDLNPISVLDMTKSKGIGLPRWKWDK